MALNNKVHSSSLLYIAICLIGIGVFCIVGIYPNLGTMKELDNEFVELTTTVQEQEQLFPVYRRLIKELQAPQPELTMPVEIKLPQEDIGSLASRFMNLAKKNNLSFDSAAPDPASYLEESVYLTMNIRLHGDFFNFRPFLLDVCQLPYLSTIDEVSIKPYQDQKELKLKIRLNQEQ